MEFVNLGRYQFFNLECRVVRLSDGLHCYVRVPFRHELYGRSSNEISLVLDAPFCVSYSAGGAHGWFIGVSHLESWAVAVECCEALARELSAFEAPALWNPPGQERASGVRPRALPLTSPPLEVDVA